MRGLTIGKCRIRAAELGPASPLPPLARRPLPLVEVDDGVDREILGGDSFGHVPVVLPYSLQDDYSRETGLREFRVAVLENDFLRATILLELGGRLWSLVHKPANLELLEVSPTLQFANLALRNAWFSGGVEWNLGTLGHSPFTCDTLFACQLETATGDAILRLYEWERFREAPFQIELFLPADSPVLYVLMRVMNIHESEMPWYWWSNIAVRQNAQTRVVAPARSALCLGCHAGRLSRIPYPHHLGKDISYPRQIETAVDLFFELPAHQRPWIAAITQDGTGLIQTSTPNLLGRKMWAWGTNSGGTNWQRFLSPEGADYIELQAGPTRTQFEHLSVEGGSDWFALEAIGFIQADASVVHGDDWDAAGTHVEEKLNELVTEATLEAVLEEGISRRNHPPGEVLQTGSGWGALERRRREAMREPVYTVQKNHFGEATLGEEQAPWIHLLEQGFLPEAAPFERPGPFVVGDSWMQLLEDSVVSEQGDHWFSWYHIGIMRYHIGDPDGSVGAWKRSLAHDWTPWAARNLAIVRWEQGLLDEAAGLISRAAECPAAPRSLLAECGIILIAAGQSREWLNLLEKLPAPVHAHGRIRLLEAQAALQVEEFETVERFFYDEIEVEDLREGENTLSDLWFAYQERRIAAQERCELDELLRARVRQEYPVPAKMDFRMR
jgi:hypothetical protein